jgi:ABC-type Na+ efflux pump permease subunit
MLRRFISLLTISVVVALVAILVWAAAQWALFVFSVEGYLQHRTNGLLLQVAGIAIFTLLSYGVICIGMASVQLSSTERVQRLE